MLLAICVHHPLEERFRQDLLSFTAVLPLGRVCLLMRAACNRVLPRLNLEEVDLGTAMVYRAQI